MGCGILYRMSAEWVGLCATLATRRTGEGDFQGLGKEHINQQNSGLNQVAAQAALATVLNPEWQALMVNMACNMAID
jgi:hypothetical protein